MDNYKKRRNRGGLTLHSLFHDPLHCGSYCISRQCETIYNVNYLKNNCNVVHYVIVKVIRKS